MKRARMPTPKVRVYRNGKATLSGVTAPDLASILTAASIHRYEQPAPEAPRPDAPYHEISVANWQAEVVWHKRQRWIIDRLLSSLHGTDQPRRMSFSERWSEVRFARAVRQQITKLFEARLEA